MYGDCYRLYTVCKHKMKLRAVTLCRDFGKTCFGPHESKGMDKVSERVDTRCPDCEAKLHELNPDARLPENDPYRKQDKADREAREQREKAFREELRQKKELDEKLAEVKRQQDAEGVTTGTKRKKDTAYSERQEKTKRLKKEKEKKRSEEREAKPKDDEDGNDSDIYNA